MASQSHAGDQDTWNVFDILVIFADAILTSLNLFMGIADRISAIRRMANTLDLRTVSFCHTGDLC